MIPIILVLAALVWLYLLVDYLRGDRLRQFPGPWLASKSSLWQLWHLYTTEQEDQYVALHRKYGDVVRISPNKLYFGSSAAAKDIYNTSRNLRKSEFYSAQEATARGQRVANFFMSTDVKYHDTVRRNMGRGFMPITVPRYEPGMDKIISLFIEQMKLRFADKSGPEAECDLGDWFSYLGMDSMGNLTYSKPYGFLEAGKDIDDIISSTSVVFDYYKYVANAPWLENLLWKNPIRMELNRRGYLEYTTPYFMTALKQHAVRQQEMNEGKEGSDDLLSTWIKAKEANPNEIDDFEVVKMIMIIVAAGGDTTGGVTAGALRYLMTHPEAYSKLQNEIDCADPEAKYKDLQKLPYLDAVVKETMRVFPVIGMALERITPKEGMVIGGHQVPGGVVVGSSMWAMHRDPSVFGDEVDKFLPERWLDPARNKDMSSNLMLFGKGKYQCLGIHIAWMQIYKNLFGVLRALKFEMVSDWKYGPGEVIQVRNLRARVMSRKT